MILLTGATGTVGSGLLARLAERGAATRAVAHSPAGREMVEGAGAEAVDGDFDDPQTLERAMAGCDRLFLLSPAHPDQPAREKAAIDAAKRAGIGHVVALSVMGADAGSASSFGRWHAEIDDHLARSGLTYTILRPSAFMQVHLLPVQMLSSAGRWYGMSGDGVTGYIDADDIAAVAVEVLTHPGDHASAIYELTGPEAISLPQAAETLADVLGRDVRYVDLDPEQYRASLTGAGLPDWVADALVGLYSAIRAGHAATVTNTVEQVTGRPARSYRQFAEDHKLLFDQIAG